MLLDIYKKLKHARSDKMVLFAMWPGVADCGTDIWETSPGLDLHEACSDYTEWEGMRTENAQ